MGIDSDALKLLLEEMEPMTASKVGAAIIGDIITAVVDKCPRMAIEICDKVIGAFTRVRDEIERDRAEQLAECRETGVCKSHREGGAFDGVAVEKRVFAVSPNGSTVEVGGQELYDAVLQTGLEVPVNPDGTIDRNALPDDMPEELKDKLEEQLPRVAESVRATAEKLQECETEEEREALLQLLRADMSVKN